MIVYQKSIVIVDKRVSCNTAIIIGKGIIGNKRRRETSNMSHKNMQSKSVPIVKKQYGSRIVVGEKHNIPPYCCMC